MKKSRIFICLTLLTVMTVLSACTSSGNKTETVNQSTAETTMKTTEEPATATSITAESTTELIADSSAVDTTAISDTESGAGASGEWGLKIDTTDLNGETVTDQDFSENKLTILNVWATWCSPCVKELPELQKVAENYADRGVQLVGLLSDGVTQDGTIDDTVVANAKLLLSDAAADYLVILPDDNLYEVLISKMMSFPTTFFIDETGEIIDVVVGSGEYEDWSAYIDGVLSKMEE